MLTQAQANLLAKALINGDFGAVASLFAPLVPQTSATIATTYPGTGVAYTNKTNFIQQVVISGGTVTVITLSAGGSLTTPRYARAGRKSATRSRMKAPRGCTRKSVQRA